MGTWTVLLADDEDEIREVLATFLQGQGHQVRVCASGREALDALGEGPYDIVVVDWHMPHITGRDVVQEIKRRGLSCAVVVMTGHVATQVETSRFERLRAVVLHKPFSLRVLHRHMTELLERPPVLPEPSATGS